MGTISLTNSLIFISLFTLAIVGFAINFATDNNAPIDISDDVAISSLYTSTKTNLSGFNNDSRDTYASILETTIAPGSQTAQSTGPFAITWNNAFFVVKNILSASYLKIFGTDSGFNIFLITLEGIILFMAALFVYKTLRGFPD